MHPARTSVITAMSTPSCVSGAPVPDSYRRRHPWQGVRDGSTPSTCSDSACRAACVSACAGDYGGCQHRPVTPLPGPYNDLPDQHSDAFSRVLQRLKRRRIDLDGELKKSTPSIRCRSGVHVRACFPTEASNLLAPRLRLRMLTAQGCSMLVSVVRRRARVHK
jgi:hypothetical protein